MKKIIILLLSLFFSINLFGDVQYGFNPKQIPNCALWLDASDSSSVALNGSNVSQWNDKSGNNNHATQGTAADQPLYNETLNNNNVINFESGDLMDLNSDINMPTSGEAFVAIKLNSIAQDNMILASSKATINNYQFMRCLGSDVGGFADGTIAVYNNNLGSTTKTTGNVTSTDISVLGVRFSGQTTNISVDGVDQALTGSIVAGGFLEINCIGELLGTGGLLKARIGEIIIYDRQLSASERLSTTEYLINKWGI
jgi:hypothetical protein